LRIKGLFKRTLQQFYLFREKFSDTVIGVLPGGVETECLSYQHGGARVNIHPWAPIMKGRVMEVPTLIEIGEKYGKSPVQVTLRWMLQIDIITIPKSARKERIIDNADVYDFELTVDEIAAINALDKGECIGPHPDRIGR
jgi:diketogulonate reductase-like aldo/keto reductase